MTLGLWPWRSYLWDIIDAALARWRGGGGLFSTPQDGGRFPES